MQLKIGPVDRHVSGSPCQQAAQQGNQPCVHYMNGFSPLALQPHPQQTKRSPQSQQDRKKIHWHTTGQGKRYHGINDTTPEDSKGLQVHNLERQVTANEHAESRYNYINISMVFFSTSYLETLKRGDESALTASYEQGHTE
jgi:hypothetical protein